MGPEEKDIDKCIQDMKGVFNLTDEEDISDNLGIKVTKLTNSCISLTQSQLIDIIIAALNFARNTKAKDIMAVSASILQLDLDGEQFEGHWDFQSVVGKLNFLRNQHEQILPMPSINAPPFQ